MSKNFILFFLILLSTISFSFAVTIELKSGKIISGDLIEKTSDHIKINLYDITLTYYLNEIKTIDGEDPFATEEETVKKEIPPVEHFLMEAMKYGSSKKFKDAKKSLEAGLKIYKDNYELQLFLRTTEDIDIGMLTQQYALNLFQGLNLLFNERSNQIKSDTPKNTQYNQAIEKLKTAQLIHPKYPVTPLALGFAFAYSGNTEKAKGSFMKAKILFQKNQDNQGMEQTQKIIDNILK